jgi:hypothetical protein
MPPVKLDSDLRAAPVHQDDDWKDPSRYPGTMLVVPKVNMQFDPRGKAFFVGSDPAVEVYLQSPEIAPRQLRIAPGTGVWSLESGNFKAELRLNGTAVQAGRYALKHGDLIELGGFAMLWVDQPREPEAPPADPAQGQAEPSPTKAAPSGPGPAAPPRAGCMGLLLAAAGTLGALLAGVR